ncbi:unnamed protein product [Cuscuta epithymum]|uniref:Zinc knuckle CX2CX4HX4C domain-containing protein n=1 Tax=Cuscuta epithymum TaxID=186058 RepID=A0AAV0ER61_9ASTE|nr:unnamed protein product [Cuscuta epithymum]
MTETVAIGVGRYLGRRVKIDERNLKGKSKEFVRICVSIDIRNALKRRTQLREDGDGWFWAYSKYERLPNLCFICGVLGHTDIYCPSNNNAGPWVGDKPYGSWMRADMRRGGTHPGNK